MNQAQHWLYLEEWQMYCFRGKSIITTYFECVFVVFGVQLAMRMRHVLIFGLLGSTIFVHIIS